MFPWFTMRLALPWVDNMRLLDSPVFVKLLMNVFISYILPMERLYSLCMVDLVVLCGG